MDIAEAKDFYLTGFARLEQELADGGRSWSREMRRAAISRFAALGFPTTRDEEWKYTSIAPIVKVPFNPGRHELDGRTREQIKRLDLGMLAENQLVFINGHFSAELSRLGRLPDGVVAGSLAAAMSESEGKMERYLGRCADYAGHSFVALNTALMEDGAFLFVPQGRVLEKPLHLLFIAAAPDGATVSHPRSLIVMDSGGQATVVESYLGFERAVYFTNGVTEIVVGENGVLDHYKIQMESAAAFHVATHQVHLDRSSNFSSHSIALGGALARNEINVALDGEGGECVLNGLYVASGQQHIDNHTRIDHVKAHCNSREHYKGILGGRSRGVLWRCW